MNKNKVRFVILKEIDNDNKFLSPNTLNIEEKVFEEQIRFLDREGLIKSVLYADDKVYSLNQVTLTIQGEIYLEQNAPMSKLYRGIKEIKDFIK